jgi:hypothetical protein
MSVLNIDTFESAENWMTIAANALYTAIDLTSQFVLVSVLLKYDFFSINVFFSVSEALPMLDHVAPTIGYGFPVHFITCVFRC